MSEILGRAAPGGTSVEPAFELVDEGLGARLDPSRPAIVRAYIPARDRAPPIAPSPRWPRRSATSRRSGCGRSAICGPGSSQEADWADAWKAYFPVMRIGRRLVIRPTWRRHRREPGDVVLALDPGMAFGTGLHPTTRLCLAGVEELADRGVSPTRGCSTSGVDRGSWPSPRSAGRGPCGRRGHGPDRDRGDRGERPSQPLSSDGSASARGARREQRPPVRRRARQPDRRGAGGLAAALHDELRPGRHDPGVGDLRRPRGRRWRGLRGGQAGGGRPTAGKATGSRSKRSASADRSTGVEPRRKRAIGGSSAGLALQSAAMPSYFPSCSARTSSWP